MKWKMSDRALFAVLLRSPWWLSFVLVAVISLASSALLPDDYKLVGALCSLPFAVVGTLAAWRQRGQLSPAQADGPPKQPVEIAGVEVGLVGAFEAAVVADGAFAAVSTAS